jgi:hypothetical protein
MTTWSHRGTPAVDGTVLDPAGLDGAKVDGGAATEDGPAVDVVGLGAGFPEQPVSTRQSTISQQARRIAPLCLVNLG